MVPESQLARSLGVNRQVVVQIRNKHLIKRTDWKKSKHQGGRVMLADSGVTKICEHLKVTVPEFGGDVNARGPTESSVPTVAAPNVPTVGAAHLHNGTFLLTVSRLFPNPYIMEAKNDSGAVFWVKVASNKFYMPGDKLKAIDEIGLATGMLKQVGAHPRWKGDKAYEAWL